jgi:hypothetical protein
MMRLVRGEVMRKIVGDEGHVDLVDRRTPKVERAEGGRETDDRGGG